MDHRELAQAGHDQIDDDGAHQVGKDGTERPRLGNDVSRADASSSPSPADDPLSVPNPPESGLRRSMEARHLVMIAMGGVIGSGLFLSSGYTIAQAGPLGAVLAYLVGAVVVYLVMACL
ncbi:MAG TPA: hypothetical protein VHH13_01650, partial [Arthrobacter sp.]|nr:hypothetical protein [Arthrobacter sp.]